MKKIGLIFLLNLLFTLSIFLIGCHAGDFTVNSYLGMQTTESELLIRIEKSPNMDNCDPSEDGLSLGRRDGQDKLFTLTYTTYSVKSFGEIRNDTYDKLLVGYGEYVETVDVAYSKTIIHSTCTAGYTWDFAQHIDGYTYCTNGIDEVFYTDGVSTTSIPSAPKGTNIVFFNNTCFIANVSGNKARVYYSVYGDPTDWTTGIAATDGDSVDVADYGQRVVDMRVLGNGIGILCSNSIMKIIGTQNPYQVIEIDKTIGCKSKGSVSVHKGWIYFMGSDGQMQRTNLSVTEDISSEDFYDDFDNTALTQRETNFVTLTNESDFGAGITSHTSTSDVLESVVCAQGTTTYTSATDWNAWTLTQVDTTTVSGSIVLDTYSSYLDQFTDGNYTSNPTWTVDDGGSGGSWSVTNNELRYSNAAVNNAYAYTAIPNAFINKSGICVEFELYLNSNETCNIFIYRSNVSPYSDYDNSLWLDLRGNGDIRVWMFGSVTYTVDTFDDCVVAGNNLIKVTKNDNVVKLYVGGVLKGTLTASKGNYNYYSQYVVGSFYANASIQYSSDYFTLDNIQFKEVYYESGQAISPIIDTEKEDAFNLVWGLVDWTDSTPTDTTHKIYIRTSNNSDMSGSSYVEQTDETQITETVKRYIQIKSTMTTKNLIVTPQLNDVTLTWATTGYYITIEIPIANINSWGLFESVDAQDDAGASITYFTYSSDTIVTDSYLKDTASWTSQTNNAIIVVSTNTYVWAKAVFDIAVASEVPRIDTVTFNWVSGDDTTIDMTALWDNNRLYLGVMQTAESSVNDAVFVYDPKLEAWWKYKSGVYPSAFYKWKNKFLIASSTYGVVAQFLEGDTDLGEDIDAYYYTKYISVGGINTVSSFESISYVYDRQDAGNLLIDYYLNGATTVENTFTLDQTNGDKIHIENFNFPLATNSYFIQFKIRNDSGSDFDFHGLYGQSSEFRFRILR